MRYDIIIVGGGLVGASFAIALRDSGLSIALLDARFDSKEDPRLFALNDTSCQFLNNLGLWTDLVPFAAPIHQVHVSHQGHFGSVRLNHHDINLRELGHVIPAKKIEFNLNQTLKTLPNLTLYQAATLKTLVNQKNENILSIDTAKGPQTLISPIVIGADGSASTVREALNIPTRYFDYQQSALVTRTTLQRPHQQIAYERFNAKGAIAMLPLMGEECATIWTADTQTITLLKALSDADFLQLLQKEFGYRLGRLKNISTRFVFPLQMIQAEKKGERGVLLLGNAAHTLHPIAAQGLNLGLFEAAFFAEKILAKTQKKEKITSDWLDQMSELTQKQQTRSIALSHRLSQFFLKGSHLTNAFSQLGMMGLDMLPPLKARCLLKMLGKSGRTPSLLLSRD